MELRKEHRDEIGNETATLIADYRRVRATTQELVSVLQPEDTVPQSMPDASPAKWHLAHTTWFFEQFLLAERSRDDKSRQQRSELFNSYYHSVGSPFTRSQRGLLTRPSLDEVMAYRATVDADIVRLLSEGDDAETRSLIRLGIHHEQQHQELLLTDIKHLFSFNPLAPAYRDSTPLSPNAGAMPMQFIEGRSGIAEIGHDGSGFAFDNEGPRHQVLLQPHQIANRPVTNGEFRHFIADGGYHNPQLWLAEGWDIVQREKWTRPLYWQEDLSRAFTLHGIQPLDPVAPVCHVSFFEADAYARWAGARLPTEAEWEAFAATVPESCGTFLESGILHPQRPSTAPTATGAPRPLQLFGDVWEWTSSPYINYPGFRPLPGALGEYNGKFMSGQWVLRGGSCVTPVDHIRPTYRNFFHPAARWQFSGLRLTKDL